MDRQNSFVKDGNIAISTFNIESDTNSISDNNSIPESLPFGRQYSEDWSVTSANSFRAYTPRSFCSIQLSPREILSKNISSILGKLTETKYESLFKKFVELEIDSQDLIKMVARKIVDQSKFSKDFVNLFSKFCFDIINQQDWNNTLIEIVEDECNLSLKSFKVSKSVIFKSYLLSMCHQEFNRDWFSEIEKIGEMNFSESDKCEEQSKLKTHRNGICELIIQLFLLKIVTFDIFKNCIDELFKLRLFVRFEKIDNKVKFLSFEQRDEANLDFLIEQFEFIDFMLSYNIENFEEFKQHPQFKDFLPRNENLNIAITMIKKGGLEMSENIREISKKRKNSKVNQIITNMFKYIEFHQKHSLSSQVRILALNLIEHRQNMITFGECTEFKTEYKQTEYGLEKHKIEIEESRKFWL